MPVKFDCQAIDDAISLDDCYEQLIESRFDPTDIESFASVAPLLKKLNNNRTFLAERLIQELAGAGEQQTNNRYTPQVLMLKAPSKHTNFFMRANIWLPKEDPMLQLAGEKSFYYHVPHDHNFHFLTSGYMGPGYHSDYYEYDYFDVEGYAGEPVDLTFIERKTLSPGEVMLYRAHLDVHNQLPADELSVSLNIMPSMMFAHLRPQYIFNSECTHIERAITTSNSSTEPALHIIARCGGESGRDFLDHLARNSVIEEDRFRAIKAIVAVLPDEDSRYAALRKYGLNANSTLVKKMSQHYAQQLSLL
ncbi:transposase [Salinimonas marina]|uniref:Transposase n=1 Tax=Salinimonas marina TaxID=2785918 RepID=A0A7S9HCY9_9ALTE|nr:transposase [Salinimonas marina]QPG05751.1 transposase [Salinimonas marina]